MRSTSAERSPALRSNRGGGVQKSPRRRYVQSQSMFFGQIYDSIRGRIDCRLLPAKNQARVRQAARSPGAVICAIKGARISTAFLCGARGS